MQKLIWRNGGFGLGMENVKITKALRMIRVVSALQAPVSAVLLIVGGVAQARHGPINNGVPAYSSGAFSSAIAVMTMSTLGLIIYFRGRNILTKLMAKQKLACLLQTYCIFMIFTWIVFLVSVLIVGFSGICSTSECSYTTNKEENQQLAVSILVLIFLAWSSTIAGMVILCLYSGDFGLRLLSRGQYRISQAHENYVTNEINPRQSPYISSVPTLPDIHTKTVVRPLPDHVTENRDTPFLNQETHTPVLPFSDHMVQTVIVPYPDQVIHTPILPFPYSVTDIADEQTSDAVTLTPVVPLDISQSQYHDHVDAEQNHNQEDALRSNNQDTVQNSDDQQSSGTTTGSTNQKIYTDPMENVDSEVDQSNGQEGYQISEQQQQNVPRVTQIRVMPVIKIPQMVPETRKKGRKAKGKRKGNVNKRKVVPQTEEVITEKPKPRYVLPPIRIPCPPPPSSSDSPTSSISIETTSPRRLRSPPPPPPSPPLYREIYRHSSDDEFVSPPPYSP